MEQPDELEGSHARNVDEGSGSRSNNSKNSRRRTKTGCLTCRRRRIKCGEERPVCANCTKSKRHCEGYNIKVVFKEPMIRGPMSSIPGHTGTLPRSSNQSNLDTTGPPRPQLPPILPNLEPRAQGGEQFNFNQPDAVQYDLQMSDGTPWSQSHHMQEEASFQGGHGQPFPSGPEGYQFQQDSAQLPPSSQPSAYQNVPQRSTAWGPSGEREVFRYDGNQPQSSHRTGDHSPADDTMRSARILQAIDSQRPGRTTTTWTGTTTYQEVDSDDDPYDVESDEDQIMADIDDGVNPLARVMERNAADGRSLQMVMRAQAAQDGRDTRKRTVHSVIEHYGPGMLATYWPSAKDSPLSDPVSASIFSHFLNVVAPSISMHERHPANTEKLFRGHQVPKSQQHLWAYTLPTIGLRNHALMHAMLAMSSLHIARLQNTSIMASLKHYHLAIRKLAKDVGLPTRRKQLATLATTLLLGYYEVMSGDHGKWCDHLLGSHQLLKQIDFAGMTKYLWQKKQEERMASQFIVFGQHHNDTPPMIDEIDEDFVSLLMGKKVKYAEFGEVSENLEVQKPERKSYTERELSMYETQKDLFWWFLKQDSLQSLLSQNKTFLNYDRWSHCPPRAPVGRRDAVYGTFDHLVLLLGRLSDFASKDLKRKRRTFKMPGGPPSKQSKQPGQDGKSTGPPPGWTGPHPPGWIGGPPPGWSGPPPPGFGPPQNQPPTTKNDDVSPIRSTGNIKAGWKGGPPPGWSGPPPPVFNEQQHQQPALTPPYEAPSAGPPPGWVGPPPPGWTGPPPAGWKGPAPSSQQQHQGQNVKNSPGHLHSPARSATSGGPPPGWTGPPPPGWQGPPPPGWTGPPPSSQQHQQNSLNELGHLTSPPSSVTSGGPPPSWAGPPPAGWQGAPPVPQSQGAGPTPRDERTQASSGMSGGPPPGWSGPPPGWQGRPSSVLKQGIDKDSSHDDGSQMQNPSAIGSGPPPGWSGPPPPGWTGGPPPGWQGPPPPGWQGASSASQSPTGPGASNQMQGPPAFQLPPFAGLLPTGNAELPRGFSPEASSPASSGEESSSGLDELTRQAEAEWQDIKRAFDVFESHLGADFQPLDSDSGLQHIDSPFGPAIQYRTYTIANIWLMYHVGLIVLERSCPPMPPSAMVAAGFCAHKTAANAITIGRIAAGIAPDARTATQVSITAGSGLNDAAFPIFVAAVQFQDAAQRQWIIQRMLDTERLTGWETASQVAKGCETSWMRAAEVGRGPRYERYVEPMPVNKIWDRAGQRMERIFASAGETTHVSSRDTAVAGRVQFAAGVIGIEIGMERVTLESDDEDEDEDEDEKVEK